MSDIDTVAAATVAVRPPKPFARRLWRFFLILLCIAFLAVNGAAYLAARTMTHYVPNAERPHIHVPMTAWDKTRLFLGTLSLPRPVNAVTPAAVQKMTQDYIKPGEMTIVVVGDKSQITDQLTPFQPGK